MTDSVKIKVKKLHPDAQLPTYAHEGDACADVYAVIEGGLRLKEIKPGETVCIGTGIAVDIPRGWMIEFRPRSGLSCTKMISLSNSPSTIDHGFKAEMMVYLRNDGFKPYVFYHGDRIVQMRPVRISTAEFEEVESLENDSERGMNGLGSTGR